MLGIEGRILDSLGFGVLVVGRWSRRIAHYNRTMSDITGIAAEDALERDVAEVFGHLQGLDLEALDAEIRATGGFESRDLRLVRPTGEVVYRHVRGDVLEGGAGEEEAVVVSVLDVTEREHMRECMSRYLDGRVADLVLACRGGGEVEAREVEVAVLVADMREFCGAAEGCTPEELFRTVNGYLGPMAEVVAGRRGAIDKFTGDGFMAVFGIPDGAAEDEVRQAVAAASDLRALVALLSAERERKRLPVLSLGYGIHCGPALAGCLGNRVRMEYTVVGDSVNVAHRIQALAEPGEVLATQAVARAAGDGFAWGDGRWVRVRGRKAPVKVRPLQ